MLGLSLWFWLMLLFLDGHRPSPRFAELGPIPKPLGWEAAGVAASPGTLA